MLVPLFSENKKMAVEWGAESELAFGVIVLQLSCCFREAALSAASGSSVSISKMQTGNFKFWCGLPLQLS